MAGTEGKGFGSSSRWIVLGVLLLAAAGGAYALLHDRLTASPDRHNDAELQAALADSELQVALIPVEGMSCAACAARVKRTLADIEGVVSAEVSLTERNVKVRYVDQKLSSENLVAAINALGYKAQAPITAESKTKATNGTDAFVVNASEPQVTSATIPVTGMACEHCVKTMEDKIAVKRLTDEIDAKGFKAGSAVTEGEK